MTIHQIWQGGWNMSDCPCTRLRSLDQLFSFGHHLRMRWYQEVADALRYWLWLPARGYHRR